MAPGSIQPCADRGVQGAGARMLLVVHQRCLEGGILLLFSLHCRHLLSWYETFVLIWAKWNTNTNRMYALTCVLKCHARTCTITHKLTHNTYLQTPIVAQEALSLCNTWPWRFTHSLHWFAQGCMNARSAVLMYTVVTFCSRCCWLINRWSRRPEATPRTLGPLTLAHQLAVNLKVLGCI